MKILLYDQHHQERPDISPGSRTYRHSTFYCQRHRKRQDITHHEPDGTAGSGTENYYFRPI